MSAVASPRKPVATQARTALEPLRIATWVGIGDCHWACTKLRALSRMHGGRPIHAHVWKGPNHASVGYLDLVPFVAKSIETELAPYHIHQELEGGYIAERWSTLEGSAGWRGFDYVLVPNGHLEAGKPLATWLPELETEYSYELMISAADREYARAIADPGSVLLYPSGTEANTGFHRNTWRPRDWRGVIERLNRAGVRPVLVGSGSKSDQEYRRTLVREARHCDFLDAIGATSIPQALAMIEDASVWCGLNSGLGIVSAMRRTPTVMLWADARYPTPRTAAATMHHAMQRSWLNEEQLQTYRTLSFGSRELTPAAVVENILQVRRAA